MWVIYFTILQKYFYIFFNLELHINKILYWQNESWYHLITSNNTRVPFFASFLYAQQKSCFQMNWYDKSEQFIQLFFIGVAADATKNIESITCYTGNGLWYNIEITNKTRVSTFPYTFVFWKRAELFK